MDYSAVSWILKLEDATVRNVLPFNNYDVYSEKGAIAGFLKSQVCMFSYVLQYRLSYCNGELTPVIFSQ